MCNFQWNVKSQHTNVVGAKSTEQLEILSSIGSIKSRKRIGFIEAFNVLPIGDQRSGKNSQNKVTLRLHARAFCWIAQRQKNSWRTRLKSSKLCLILCLSGHNIQCCESVVDVGASTEKRENKRNPRKNGEHETTQIIQFMFTSYRLFLIWWKPHQQSLLIVKVNFNQLKLQTEIYE